MRIKKGDEVKMLAGRERGKKGKVVKVLPGRGSVIVEGLNLHKKHTRPRQAGRKGEIVMLPGPIPLARVQLVCPRCSRASRVGYEITGGIKSRVCKKCHQTI